ncbi:hypothetical protein NW062_02185 [Mycoplasmopsis cynos]|nr:hypothetical protein NW062_02185 [Mycoplasmopsis cynos]
MLLFHYLDPIPSMYIPIYAKCKKNDLFIEKVHPKYDNIVKNTYGIIVYQEQIMQIVQDVARMPFSKEIYLEEQFLKKMILSFKCTKLNFFTCFKNGLILEDLQKIYSNIEKFASYGFNKSHAVAYALISYKLDIIKLDFRCIFIRYYYQILQLINKILSYIVKKLV